MPFEKAGCFRLRRWPVQGWRWKLPDRPTGYGLLEPAAGSRTGAERLAGWARSVKRRLNGPEEKRAPKGQLVVYVCGGEKGAVGSTPRRYVVPVVYFNHPLFGELLGEVEEEFGFWHPGGIRIPCSVGRFEGLKARIAADGIAF